VAAALAVGRHWAFDSWLGVSAVALAPWSVLPAGVAVLGLLALSGWRAAVPATVLVALAGWPLIVTAVPGSQSASAPIVTVMSANTLHGQADPNALVATVTARGVDVLALQELTAGSIDALSAAGLDRVLPYRSIAVQPGGTDVGLWSRYPLTDPHMPTGFTVNPVQARITVGGHQVSVIAFHSQAPVSERTTQAWQSDLRRLADIMRTAGASTVVAGDFNATRDHLQFRDLLAAGYTDSGSDAGAGLLRTYPADRFWGPLVGIDHVLVGADLVGVEVGTVAQPGSDHRAVVAAVAPRDTESAAGQPVLSGGWSGAPSLGPPAASPPS
jgi:endonuclease/exonuclease/phosphatase (EEP) superfamily protein YafD